MHPPEELLLSFATGEADLPHRALIEAHLSSCAICSATVGELAAPGGLLLQGLDAAPVPDALWSRLAQRLQAAPQDASLESPLARSPLPEAARRELPPAVLQRTPEWHLAGTWGAYYTTLAVDPATGSTLYLGRIGPGRKYPLHTHVGQEDTLVLAGGYEDQRGVFELGHYAVYEDGSAHSPRTEPDEDCWLLWRLEHPVRFAGWRGVVQRLWMGKGA